MSKFVDRLKNVSKGYVRPMGFNAVASAPPPKMLLAAELDIENLTDKEAFGGADVVLVSAGKASAKKLKEAADLLGETVWGVMLGDKAADAAKMAKAGADFVVFSPDAEVSPLTALEKTGKIIILETNLTDFMIRAADCLSVGAVIVGEQADTATLSWRKIMLYQRFADILSKPFLVRVSSNITLSELQSLWALGIDGVLVSGSAGLKELHTLIDKAEWTPKRKRGHMSAIVPSLKMPASESVAPEEPEEPDEGDEE
ncbi:MAG: hypothetical protein QY871_02995 [Dehalococcoides mccartyi]|uniref:hypothetical protein n=1 Tax=Dehalococcoides mccartyi TaxID=61435 RepID=UPI0025CB6151|nr:hypothetical protein [Dehalococcoides mccartyi]MDN4186026.1 hypothetical protein [Dehalococcoides mccartyi]